MTQSSSYVALTCFDSLFSATHDRAVFLINRITSQFGFNMPESLMRSLGKSGEGHRPLAGRRRAPYLPLRIGAWPSGKAPVFGIGIRRILPPQPFFPRLENADLSLF